METEEGCSSTCSDKCNSSCSADYNSRCAIPRFVTVFSRDYNPERVARYRQMHSCWREATSFEKGCPNSITCPIANFAGHLRPNCARRNKDSLWGKPASQWDRDIACVCDCKNYKEPSTTDTLFFRKCLISMHSQQRNTFTPFVPCEQHSCGCGSFLQCKVLQNYLALSTFYKTPEETTEDTCSESKTRQDPLQDQLEMIRSEPDVTGQDELKNKNINYKPGGKSQDEPRGKINYKPGATSPDKIKNKNSNHKPGDTRQDKPRNKKSNYKPGGTNQDKLRNKNSNSKPNAASEDKLRGKKSNNKSEENPDKNPNDDEDDIEPDEEDSEPKLEKDPNFWGYKSTSHRLELPDVKIPQMGVKHNDDELADNYGQDVSQIYSKQKLQSHNIPDPYNAIPLPEIDDNEKPPPEPKGDLVPLPIKSTPFTQEPTSGLRAIFSSDMAKIIAKNQTQVSQLKTGMAKKEPRVEYEIYQDDYRLPKYRVFNKNKEPEPEDFAEEAEIKKKKRGIKPETKTKKHKKGVLDTFLNLIPCVKHKKLLGNDVSISESSSSEDDVMKREQDDKDLDMKKPDNKQRKKSL